MTGGFRFNSNLDQSISAVEVSGQLIQFKMHNIDERLHENKFVTAHLVNIGFNYIVN